MSKEFLASQKVVGIVTKKENDQFEVELGEVRNDYGKLGVRVKGVDIRSPDPDFQLSLGGEFDDHLLEASRRKSKEFYDWFYGEDREVVGREENDK